MTTTDVRLERTDEHFIQLVYSQIKQINIKYLAATEFHDANNLLAVLYFTETEISPTLLVGERCQCGLLVMHAVITIAIRLRYDYTIRLRRIARASFHSTRFDASKK